MATKSTNNDEHETAPTNRGGGAGVGGEPRLVITSTPLDLELCELLGEKPADFIILLADGKQVPDFGTPYDSPGMRKNRSVLCDHLNARGKESLYPEFVENWGAKLAQICEVSADYRPVFSLEIHRVCAGRSQYLHSAIRLFEEMGERVSEWGVGVAYGLCNVELVMNRKRYAEEGTDVPLTICIAVARALREGGGGGAERQGDKGACEQERWRLDEWADNHECWWVVEHHGTYRAAEAHLDNLVKTRAAPTRRWRVVWIRERVQLQSHKSPTTRGSPSWSL